MNILHIRYAYEVAKSGSLKNASEKLFVAVPNISRGIKELESSLGITIFERTAKGMQLTPEGEEFMQYAKQVLKMLGEMETLYKGSDRKKHHFSISGPRASYIAEAFAEFSKAIGKEETELFYKETNSKRTIRNILEHDYKLGILRYAAPYDVYFKTMLEEKNLSHELVTEFTYRLVISRQHPLAQQERVTFDDLRPYIEVAHADPYVPSLPLSKAGQVRLICGNAVCCEPDSQGRILIPPTLREYAELKKDVTVIGMIDHVEIWDSEKWKQYNDSTDTEEVAAMMDLLGV